MRTTKTGKLYMNLLSVLLTCGLLLGVFLGGQDYLRRDDMQPAPNATASLPPTTALPSRPEVATVLKTEPLIAPLPTSVTEVPQQVASMPSGSIQSDATIILCAEEQVQELPILMYHVIADYSGYLEELYVSPEHFAAQLDYLERQGYHTITFSALREHWEQGIPLPEQPIILSFDDGYLSVYTEAFPRLKSKRMRAVVFTILNHLGREGSLSPEMLQEMAESGMEIGSHSLNHPNLTSLDTPHLRDEAGASKQGLERVCGKNLTAFCYPAGRYNDAVRQATAEAGYTFAVTTDYGLAKRSDDRYALRRVRINKSDALAGFIAKLEALR